MYRVITAVSRTAAPVMGKQCLLARGMATRFAKSHEYIKMDGDVGTVGITGTFQCGDRTPVLHTKASLLTHRVALSSSLAFAAAALGDIVFVDLPSVGAKYSAGDSFGSVESVKAASDVYVPVACEVVAVNSVSSRFARRLAHTRRVPLVSPPLATSCVCYVIRPSRMPPAP